MTHPLLLKMPLWLTLVIIASCATQPLYSPASQPGDAGYSETRLTDNRFRISFMGRSATPSDQVRNYALLRAAELTLNNGYDWFKVVERETQETARDREPRVSIGLGTGCHPYGCRMVGSPWYTGVHLDSRRYADRYHTSMEILMGVGEPDEPNSVYNAEELVGYLRNNTDSDSLD